MHHHPHIVGVGLYAPEKIVKNDFFDQLYKKDIDTFLRERRNILQRHFMADNQATSDLVVAAAKDALKMAGITPRELDLIIVATDTPDYLSPSTAAVVQYKLGARNCGTFDLNSACAGFVIALDTASKYIRADHAYKNILVVGAYGMSKFLNYDDYKIASLFGDGAGAVVLQSRAEAGGVQPAQLYTDGQYHDYMGIYAGGTYMPLSEEVLKSRHHLLNFAKKIPNETNPTHWPKLIQTVLDHCGKKPEDVASFFMTQINIDSINETLSRLGLPRTKSHNIMDKYGYTGSASIPMALADAALSGKLHKGDLIALIGSGGGLSMAALAMTWSIETGGA